MLPHFACASSSIGGVFEYFESSWFRVRQGGDFFQLDISPKIVDISTDPTNDGNLAFVTVYLVAYNNYEGTIHFGVLNIPQGVVATYAQNDIAVNQTSSLIETRLKLTAAPNAEIGDHIANVTAVGPGASERQASLTIRVFAEQMTCPAGAVCQSIPPTTTSTTSEPEPLPTWVTVAAVVAFVMLVAFLIAWRRKERAPKTIAPEAPSQALTYCRKCGKQIPRDSKFCDLCGARLA